MHRRWSHTVWALPLLTLMVLQLGQLASFEWRRRAVRKEIKQRLKAGVPSDERTAFHLTEAEYISLDWVKPQREFRLDGRFYDVVELHVRSGGLFSLSCIDDRQETELFARLSEMVDLAMGERGEGRKQTAPMFALWKVLDEVTAFSIVPIRSSSSTHHPDPGAIPLKGLRMVPSPPPRA